MRFVLWERLPAAIDGPITSFTAKNHQHSTKPTESTQKTIYFQ
ncbi:hypothetical protein D1BOALGB6SA_10487 [Olavius sp. associated proteobacterium Delta 1]|nr:hypothetical protein D1BOALGB6SA_10487 [Olavius sp. associated proteobacterium Delta 1]